MAGLTRRVLVVGGVGIAVLGVSSVLACRARSSAEHARFDRLDVLLAGMVEPVRVGRTMRQMYGTRQLEDHILAIPNIVDTLDVDCPETRRSLLADRCRSDFAENRISICNRFVLSWTESLAAGLRYDAWQV